MKIFVIAQSYIDDTLSMKQIEASTSLEAASIYLPDYYEDYIANRRSKDEDAGCFEDLREWLYDNCELDIEVLEIQ